MSRTPTEFVGFPECLSTLLSVSCDYGPYRAVSRYDDERDDGDTALFMIDPGWDVYPIESVRFLGINAPEKSTPEGEKIQKLMGTARYLHAGTQAVLITSWAGTSFGRDKYGRLLGLVFIERNGAAMCVNNELVRLGHAQPYIGWKDGSRYVKLLADSGLVKR